MCSKNFQILKAVDAELKDSETLLLWFYSIIQLKKKVWNIQNTSKINFSNYTYV